MSSNSERQEKAETIFDRSVDQSLEELHALLSVLEQQIQSRVFSAQSRIKTVQTTMPENRSPHEDDSLL